MPMKSKNINKCARYLLKLIKEKPYHLSEQLQGPALYFEEKSKSIGFKNKTEVPIHQLNLKKHGCPQNIPELFVSPVPFLSAPFLYACVHSCGDAPEFCAH